MYFEKSIRLRFPKKRIFIWTCRGGENNSYTNTVGFYNGLFTLKESVKSIKINRFFFYNIVT